jgi:hypothetical protein
VTSPAPAPARVALLCAATVASLTAIGGLAFLAAHSEELLFSQGGVRRDPRVVALRAEVQSLESLLAALDRGTAHDRGVNARSAASPSRLDALEERIGALASAALLELRLLGSDTLTDGKPVRIEDILYSAEHHRQIALDPARDALERARAFGQLRSLPNSIVMFDQRVRDAWLDDYHTAPSQEVRRALLFGVPGTGGDPRVRDALLDVLIADPDAALRERAASALRDDLGDEAVARVFELGARTDPAPSVRQWMQRIRERQPRER